MAEKLKEMSLAQRLRVLRAREGLSLVEVGERAGVHPDSISALERGKRRAYRPTLRKLAKVYGVPLEELLAPEPQEHAPQGEKQEEPILSEEDDAFARRVAYYVLRGEAGL